MEEKLPQILVIDDEPDMCWALANILRPAGYAVTTAKTGTEALEFIATCKRSYAAAFVDAKLPDMDGFELAVSIRQRSPHTAIVILSGFYYAEDRAIAEGLHENLFMDFVSKPFSLDQVRLTARQAMAHTWNGGESHDPHSLGG